MSHRVIVRPEAQQELRQAFEWYESQSDGLGFEFLLAAQATQESLRRNPELYPMAYRNARRALIQRFPFSIFYSVTEEIIYILAVYHARRNPEVLQKRFRTPRKQSKRQV